MDPERFAQIKQLFNDVCDLPEAERNARLQACGDDLELIERVQALLAQAASASLGVGQLVIDNLAQLCGDELAPGDRLGAWTLIGELGHGGMGTVYSAQRSDGHFEQKAAIKLLRGVPNAAALSRLSQERQILARLTHPHIARLLEGGATPAGQPYLVLEHIEGEPIDQYCQRLQLSPSAIVQQLLGVCEALEFAHQHLVVHCDLKPSNILVNREGRSILVDFGIARLLGGNASGGADGRPVGYTPGFSSPEQRNGSGVSAASDLFGVGRVLQVLLQQRATSPAGVTGTPLEAMSVEPVLAVIIRRCTEPDPALRYPSASALIEDLRRFLGNRAVAAMGNDRLYQLRCYIRRNTLPLGLGVLAAIALLGGLVSTTLSLREARAQSERAEIASKRAERTADFLGNLLSAVDPDRARDLDKTLLRELLQQAADKAQQQLTYAPLVLTQIAEVIGTTYHQLGEYEVARKQLQLALDLRPTADVRERLRLREKLANANGALGMRQQALAEYQLIHDQRLSAFGPDDSETLKSAETLNYQLASIGEFQRAVHSAAALQPRLERLLGPNDPTALANLQTLAVARTELGDFDTALPILQTLIARHVAVYGEYDSRTLGIQNSLAVLYLRQKRFAEAQLLLQEIHPIAVKYLGANNFKSINLAALLASALRKGGHLEESGTYYALALDSAKAALGPDNGIVLQYEANYANYEIASGQPAAGLARCQRIADAYIALVGTEHPNTAELYRTQARALTALNRRAESLTMWQQALAIDRKVFADENHAQVIEDLAGIEDLQQAGTSSHQPPPSER